MINYVPLYLDELIFVFGENSEVGKMPSDFLVFLLGKINSVIVSLVLLGLFTDHNDAFSYPFIYYSY